MLITRTIHFEHITASVLLITVKMLQCIECSSWSCKLCFNVQCFFSIVVLLYCSLLYFRWLNSSDSNIWGLLSWIETSLSIQAVKRNHNHFALYECTVGFTLYLYRITAYSFKNNANQSFYSISNTFHIFFVTVIRQVLRKWPLNCTQFDQNTSLTVFILKDHFNYFI